ncbi:MAG: secretin N-terminal domain-containing protein [Candidatus Omnitrophica bacterium]|nr:secretin N-terminal domain-containing protein [Candidatus Omnitrophota bacterium]
MTKRMGFLVCVILCACFFVLYQGNGVVVSAQDNNVDQFSDIVNDLEQEIISSRQAQPALEDTLDEEAAFDEQAAYDEQDAYGEEDAYDEEAAYDEQDAYDEEAVYDEQDAYDEEEAYNEEDSFNRGYLYKSAESSESAEIEPEPIETKEAKVFIPSPKIIRTSSHPIEVSPSVSGPECITCDLPSKPTESDLVRVDASSKRLAKLEKAGERMTIDFKESELDKVFRLFSEWAGINIILDPKLKDVMVTVHLKDVTLTEAMDIVLNSYGLKQAEVGDSIFVASSDRINSMDSVTKVIQLKNIKAKNVEKLLKDIVKSLASDEESNAIVITGTPYEIEEASRIVAKVDRPQKQVLLTTQILEVNYSSDKEIGVDWNDSTSISFQETKNLGQIADGATITSQPPPLHIYRMGRTALKFDLTIKHLLSTGKAKLLANPKITAVNGKEAHIFIGDSIPYEVTTISGGATSTEVRFTEAGVKLALTPSIIEDDYVVVTVAPEVSFIAGWRGTDDQYPWVRTRRAEASMRVKDGETFILGGLISEDDKVNNYKFPFLGDIPILGNLFKYEKTEKDKKEIIITVTPQIIVN